MEIPIIRIGNSKGILLNKTLLERYAFKDKIEIVMKQDHIELKPAAVPRQGWEEQFKQMHENGDDRQIMDELFDEDYLEEWK